MKSKCSFYKKKSFYIVLIVIFTILLIADVLIGGFASSMNKNFGGNHDFSQMQGMPSMEDFQSGEGNPFGGEMPSGEGNPFGGEMPSDGDFSFDGEGMPSRGERPSAGNMSSVFGFLQFVGKYWIIIAVVLAVLDGISIFMLIRIIKNEKKNKKNGTPRIGMSDEQQFEADDTPKEYPILNKMKESLSKTKAGRAFLQVWQKLFGGHQRLIALALVIVLLFVVITGAMGNTNEVMAQTEASVYSGTVEKGEIITTVPGTGTLTDAEGESLELPSGIKFTQRYVSNGDVVAKGEKIAQVDLVSVMSAIAELQDLLDALDEELEEHEEETISERVKSGTDGKVKVIYAKEDVDILDTMYEHGALMLISLDGMMAVTLETEASLSAGDSVTVTTEDDETLDGKVQSVTKEEVVITVSDDEAEYGEAVTVSTEDGTSIGSGELYIHSELKVTGYAGTVSSISVEVNDEVEKGDTLLKLSNTEYSGEYEKLLLKRAELEEMMQELLRIYQDQYIYAKIDGVILGLDEDGVTLASDGGTSVGMSAPRDSKVQPDEEEIPQANEEETPQPDEGEVPQPDEEETPQPDEGEVPQPDEEETPQPDEGDVPNPDEETTPLPNDGGIPQPDTGVTPQTNNGMISDVQDGLGMDQMAEEETYELETVTYFSIIPQNEVSISITVDEMDIRSIKTGQTVEITLDAFPGQAFTGEVSTIGYNGTNSGGSTKYNVVVSMERQENMLSGMNASVAIQIEKAEGLVAIPVNALVEDETGLYVYTSYNEEKQEFGNPVIVTTGLSDGINVEILSGLEEGNTYWYSINDVVNYSTASSASGSSMFGGGMSFGGGGNPFGGRR